MADEKDEHPATIDSSPVIVRLCVGFSRRHKNMIHGALLAGITASLIVDGAKIADWLFVVLAVVVEVN